jgi:hypothetical protein
MQKVILDTNVIVSALISKGVPSQIIEELVLEKKVKICISAEVFGEYVEVLNREKFARFKDFKSKAEEVISKIEEIAEKYAPNVTLNIISDQSDNKFLELAVVSGADYLITGNTNDFTISNIENTQIVTPRTFWDNFKF